MPSIELPYEIRVVEVTVPGPLTRVVEVIVPGPQGPPGEVSQAQLNAESAARESADTSHAAAGDPHAGYRLESTPISAADVAADIATQAELNALDAVTVKDGDVAGGVLSGTFPSPGFAVDMATQAEVDALSGTYVKVNEGPLSLLDTRVNAPRDGTSVLAALNAAVALVPNGGEVFAPPGEYTLLAGEEFNIPDTPVTGAKGFTFRGAGKGATRLRKIGAGHGINATGPANGTGITNMVLADFSLIGDATSTNGIHGLYLYHSDLDRLDISGFGGSGIYTELGFYNSLNQLWVHDNVLSGLHIGHAANATMVFGGHYRINGQHGILADGANGAQGNPHGCSIFGATFESNGSHDVKMYRAYEIRLIGNYFEANSADPAIYCVYMDAPVNNTDGFHVLGANNFSGTKRSVYVGRSNKTCIGPGNSINRELVIDTNATGTKIAGNPRIDGPITDNGSGTQMLNDPTDSGQYYVKQGTTKVWTVTAGGVATILDAGPNYIDIKAGGITVARFRNDTWQLRLVRGLEIDDGRDVTIASGTGSMIGQSSSKIGFFGATPVVKPAANPDTSGATLAALETEVNELKATLRSLGLVTS